MDAPPHGPLDPGSREPLHAQLAARIRELINDRDILPGEPLPTEARLQEQFGVSRSVARQAMSTLVSEGLVVRGRGRGSVVAPERQHHRIVDSAAGLYSQIGATGARLSTEILHLGEERAPRSIPVLGGAPAIRLERLRSIDGLPSAVIRTWLPLRFGQGLTADELTDSSLHGVISERHGIVVNGGSRQVRAVAADARMAALLGVRAGAPLLLLEGITETEDGEVLEHFSTWHRGDLIAFDVEVAARPRSARAESGAVVEAARSAAAALHSALARYDRGDR